MPPSMHELRRMVRNLTQYRGKCDRCDKRRVLGHWMTCRECRGVAGSKL